VISDALSNHGGDGGDSALPVHVAGVVAISPTLEGAVLEYRPSYVRVAFLLASPGRAPPSVS
jgi:hypothetical protein